jgi:predicted nuclease with TOPRIM domain
MKIKYYADDGKNFETKEQCLEYEDKMKQIKERDKKLAIEKEKRWDEVSNAYNKYNELLDKFYKDYVDSPVNSFTKIFFGV